MARLPRLVVAGHTHCVLQRGHSGFRVFADAVDRGAFVAALREAAATEQVQIHAYALLDDEVLLLATPTLAPGLGRMVQSVGRRYVSAYNRRHHRSGTLWDGRFRCAVVEPGPLRLAAQVWADASSAAPGQTTAAQHLGGASAGWLTDLPEYWQLGNTPFEREAAYRGLLDAGVAPATAVSLRQATLGGWAAGSVTFAAAVAASAQRPARPRPRGRPAAARA